LPVSVIPLRCLRSTGTLGYVDIETGGLHDDQTRRRRTDRILRIHRAVGRDILVD